jgi:hypothetical protein
MTEAKWLASNDPNPMLKFLRGKASERKMRLFAVAGCRMIWSFLTCPRSREAVEMSERRADDPSYHKEMIAAGQRAKGGFRPDFPGTTKLYEAMRLLSPFGAAENCSRADPRVAASRVSAYVLQFAWPDKQSSARSLASFLRDIFGNPFRPSPPLPPAVLTWNDATVRRIAEGIYEERAFDRLPILHDALLDAGCDDKDILAHCRSAGPHVRGCWVIDLILGKQ